MKLTKRIPAHNVTLEAAWCKQGFLKYTVGFRGIRSRFKNKMGKCYWCGHPFEDEELMALACFKGKGNEVLCQACADKLIASDTADFTKKE